MSTRLFLPAICSSLFLLAAHAPAARAAAPDALPFGNDASLSLVPRALPVPPELLLGTLQQSDTDEGWLLRSVRPESEPVMQAFNLLQPLARTLYLQDSPWPLGTLTSGHFQWVQGDGLRQWVPFVSVLQEVDELDAHPRDGVGAGVTYRFTRDLRLDIEGSFLHGSGDVNPALSDEGRASVLFTLTF